MSSLIQAILTQACIVSALSHASDNFSVQKWRQSIKSNVGFFPSPPQKKNPKQNKPNSNTKGTWKGTNF